ncbi:MAG TPA: hypothetical protein VJX68_02370 [Candidatus Binatus sp.]|uniref:hypothetical protein n=1 Tax=Candidatus Binatus sp. TaxID=2811406 RepID=UPI002B46561E|nr:hypothetical protein [Candidatus Binatus sp.]HKN12014.1 hypothetical protein [Candidatus Binatus sp.]
MKFGKLMVSAVGAAAMLVVATAPAALAKGKPSPGPNEYTVGCGDGTIVVSPETLWPPNHKLKTIDITYVETAPDADTISLTINSITDDQIAQDPGTGGTPDGCGPSEDDWEFDSTPVTNTDPNAVGTTVQVRAERCGSLGDRHYAINLTCGTTDGTPVTIDVPVVVPHNHPKHTH